MSSQEGVTVIIPTLNEEAHLERCLESLNLFSETLRDGSLEVLIADGGSSDRTSQIARRYPHTKVLQVERGRAQQMNAAAKAASQSLLLFLHADSVVPENALLELRQVMQEEEVVAGAFGFRLDADGVLFRIIEWGTRIRSQVFRVPYGDQGIFVRRACFEQVGGYPEQPILEDLELWRKLRRLGKTKILPSSILTSSRRWTERGVLKTTGLNWLVVILNWCGASPERLRAVRDF